LGQQITGVDDDGAFDGGCVDEGALGRAHLQAAAFVLEEERYGAWIRLVDVGLGAVEGTHRSRCAHQP
jgi:hypothetical protein